MGLVGTQMSNASEELNMSMDTFASQGRDATSWMLQRKDGSIERVAVENSSQSLAFPCYFLVNLTLTSSNQSDKSFQGNVNFKFKF